MPKTKMGPQAFSLEALEELFQGESSVGFR
jgi:hypothetical protein